MQLRPYKDVARANFGSPSSHNVILVLNLFSKEEDKLIVKYCVHVLRAPCGGPVLYIQNAKVSGGNNIMPDPQMLKEHYNRQCSLTLWGKTVQ